MATSMAVARHLRSAVSTTRAICMLTGSPRPSLSCTTAVVCRRWFRSCSWSGSWQHWWSGCARETARLMNMRPLLCAATVFFWDRERITNQEVMSCLERFKNSQLWRTDSDSSSNDSHTSEQTRTASQYSTPCEGDSCEKDECMSTCQVEGGVAGEDMSREKTTEGLADGDCEGDSESGDGDSNVSVTDKLKSLTASSNTSHVEHSMKATVGDNEGNTTQASYSSSSSDISQSPSDTHVLHSAEVSDGDGCNVANDRDERCVKGTLPASGDCQSQSDGDTHNVEVTERMVEAEQEKGHENGNQELVVVVEQASDNRHADDGDKCANNLSGDDEKENRNQSVLVISGSEKEDSETKEEEDPLADWDFLLKEQSCTIYRKQYENTGLYQFKVLGRYTDITAKDYLDVQVDNEARKVWDTYVVKLDTVDCDPNTGSEIVHWILKYPFPMANREYLFVRRAWINNNNDTIVVISRSVDKHPRVPQNSRCVRVKTYFSEMVIKADTDINEAGFSYELTYFDNPGTYLPSTAVSWVTNAATPDFLRKIHSAALQRSKASQQQRASL